MNYGNENYSQVETVAYLNMNHGNGCNLTLKKLFESEIFACLFKIHSKLCISHYFI